MTAQAQAIFDSLFPDCVSNGTVMSSVVDVRDGTHESPKSEKTGHYLVTSKHLLEYGVNRSDAKLISNDDYRRINERSRVEFGDILISMIGTVGLVSFVSDKDVDFAIKNVGLFRTSQNKQLRFYILNYLKSRKVTNYIEQHLAGSTQKYISLAELRNLPIFIPSDYELNSYNALVAPIYNLIFVVCRENQRLAFLRDVLLPRLMSGELDVSELDI
ncbi:MAG: restriction endonuclease subunit S [Thermoguttaceae bacterium]|nr:restriction endonuclease subunit S [Thermoguttaceae bacterium]